MVLWRSCVLVPYATEASHPPKHPSPFCQLWFRSGPQKVWYCGTWTHHQLWKVGSLYISDFKSSEGDLIPQPSELGIWHQVHCVLSPASVFIWELDLWHPRWLNPSPQEWGLTPHHTTEPREEFLFGNWTLCIHLSAVVDLNIISGVWSSLFWFPGPVWICPDSCCRGGQRHSQSSASVKTWLPSPTSTPGSVPSLKVMS